MVRLILVLMALLVLFVLAVLSVGFAIYQSSRKRVGYIPLPPRAVPAVVKALNIKGGATVFDLGCGDGRILAAALRANPHATGVGVECHPLVAWLARWRLQGLGQRAQVVRGNLLQTDLRAAAHVFNYLNPPTMAALEPKFERELTPGTRLVSCDFPLPHRQPNRTITIGQHGQLGQTLYVYDY